MPRRWLAAGLNAHQQLDTTDGNVTKFKSISSNTGDILLSTWSTLLTRTSNTLVSLGHQRWTQQVDSSIVLHSLIGDHNGFKAGLDDNKHLWVLETHLDRPSPSLRRVEAAAGASLPISMAMAGNGRVVCAIAQATKDDVVRVVEYQTFDAFKLWHSRPTSPDARPSVHHTVPGTVKQLVAGTATFAMLMDDGSLYTWGDPRYQSLGRSTTGPDATAAAQPGLVDALCGLSLHKIALGGWMGGALSEDGAAYLWGSGMPGKEARLESLKPRNGEHVALIELDLEEEPDVVDIAIGDGHAALVTADGDVYVVGENNHGQLGHDQDRSFESRWRRVEDTGTIRQVVCGPKATFLLQES